MFRKPILTIESPIIIDDYYDRWRFSPMPQRARMSLRPSHPTHHRRSGGAGWRLGPRRCPRPCSFPPFRPRFSGQQHRRPARAPVPPPRARTSWQCLTARHEGQLNGPAAPRARAGPRRTSPRPAEASQVSILGMARVGRGGPGRLIQPAGLRQPVQQPAA